MVEVVKVVTKKQQKEFVDFPLKLYKGCPLYVPMLYIDEIKIFGPNATYSEQADSIFFNAYKDGKMVGRISGIVQKAANSKWNQNRVRFTRFDSIDDQEVADSLFDAVVAWAKTYNLTEMVGPLGYSDLEREGLLIEGFDQLGTYEEQYNYEYYAKLIENYGFAKEVDWVEAKMYVPEEKDERLARVSSLMMKRYDLHIYQPKSINKFLKKYSRDLFDIIDKTYDRIYGTVPFTDKMAEGLISSFKLLVKPSDVCLIMDKNERVVGFGLMFASISEIVVKSKGHITLPFIFRFLKAKRHPKIYDLALIGLLPEYEGKGIATMVISELIERLRHQDIDHLETNLMLENNHHIQNLGKNFRREFNKRRRCYVKEI